MSTDNLSLIIAAVTATGTRPSAPIRADFDEDANYRTAVDRFQAANELYDVNVRTNARSILSMASEGSKTDAQISAMRRAIDRNSKDGKVFYGTVVGVSREDRSTRGLVVLHTGTSQVANGLPAGHEQVRTDRTDDADGRAMARTCQLLIGHKVKVFIELEPTAGGQTKVRVLRHIEDLGIDAAAQRPAA